jgi:fibronectin-binding autotransporter adhesin
MKTPLQKFTVAPANNTPRRTLSPAHKFAGIIPAILCFLLATLSAGAATTNFLNVVSVANGGSYGLESPYWNNTSETATPLVDFVAGDYTTIGANPSDFNGYAFSINFNESSLHLSGSGSVIAIYATNAVVTFNGADNDYLDGATTFYVAPGSTLIEDVLWDGYGLNFDKQTVTLTGGGTITFQAPIGVNESSGGGIVTENMPGGTVNLDVGTPTTDPFTTGYTLTAGALIFTTAAAANAFNGFTTAAFTINGGTIDNTSGSPITMGMTTGTNVLGGNFTFTGSSSLNFGPEPWTNNANHTITVLANQITFGGGIRGLGTSLTLVGASASSTVALAGANTYTGNTIVQGGTLALTNLGSLASPLTLISNATFDISGLNANYNGSGTGAIILTNSTFNLSNTLVTAVSTFGVTNAVLGISELSSAATNVATTVLNVGGTTNIINITALPLVTSYPQTYRLIQAGTVNGTLNFGLGTIPSVSPAYVAYLTNITASGSVELVLTGGPVPVRSLVWSGLDGGVPNGTWDVGNTPTWLNGGSPATFNELDFVTFNDTVAGLTTVNLSGYLTPGSLVVNNNAETYTFTGGSLSDGSGPLSLNKQGSGTLVLQESGDNFSGGINASAGTVVVDNNSSGITGGAIIASGATLQLGNNDPGDVLPSGAITVNGTLALDAADIPTTVNSEILGSGEVEQVNTNTVILADNGASSGNWSVLVTNGTLQAADNTALGSIPGGTVTITNGGTFDVGGNATQNNADFGTKQFNIAGAGVDGNGAIVDSSLNTQEDAFQNIALTANATIGGAGRWDIRNGAPVLNLNGFTLTKTNANTIALISAQVTGGNIVIQQGILGFELTPNVTGTGTILVNSGAYLGLYESSLGSITREVVLNGGGVQNLSGAGEVSYLDAPILLTTNSTFATVTGIEFNNGVISDGGNHYGITQTGTGDVGVGTNMFSATNTYTGATYVGQGSLGLTNHGSMDSSELIMVTNEAIFDVSGLAVPFSGTNSLVIGDDTQGQGIFNLGATLMTNFNYLSLSNATLNMAVASVGVAQITVTNLNLGDGGAQSGLNIIALPVVLPAQLPLIKYVSVSGSYNNLYLASLPNGYSGNLVNNTANHSIDLAITGQPAGIWNGGGSPNNDWSDAANWSGESLTGTDPLVFTGTAGLNNTNDTSGETATLITFYAGAGAFTLNGNGVTLNGGVTNSSSNPQTINLGLSFGSNGTNYYLTGGSTAATALVIDGGLTNTAALLPGYTTLTLAGYGVLANTLNSANATGGTNIFLLTSGTANWTLMNNASSTAMTVPWDFQINAGTFNFGSGTSAPVLTSTSAQGVPQDNQVGDVSGATGTFNMNAGTWTTTARLNSALATSSTGVVSQVGGTLNIANQFQGANGSNTNEDSIVLLTGGTMNIDTGATPTGQFFVSSRGTGSLTLSNSAALNCGTLDVARNANGNTFGSVGVVNLDGGILTVGSVGTATANSQTGPPSLSGANPSATFNFNGGTLKASGNNVTNFFQGSLIAPIIPITALVKAGGAIISDGGFAITIATPLIHDSTLGATADGGLIKSGAGTLALTGTNTYTGGTTVSNGVLAVDGSLAAGSAVTVTAAGTLSGNGTIGGNVTVNGTIAPGTTTNAATLTALGNVTIAGTITAKLDLNNSANDELVVGGALTYGGTLNVILLSGTPALNQTFKLFNATSESGSFVATNLPALTAGLAWNFNPSSGVLSVVQAQTINTTPAPIVATVSGNTLSLMWPANQTGWTLQVQTNSTAAGLGNNWVSVPGSTSGNTYSITIDPTQGCVFYRLYYLP